MGIVSNANWDGRNKKLSLELLEGLSQVKRFEINVKLMLSKEKKGK